MDTPALLALVLIIVEFTSKVWTVGRYAFALACKPLATFIKAVASGKPTSVKLVKKGLE